MEVEWHSMAYREISYDLTCPKIRNVDLSLDPIFRGLRRILRQRLGGPCMMPQSTWQNTFFGRLDTTPRTTTTMGMTQWWLSWTKDRPKPRP